MNKCLILLLLVAATNSFGQKNYITIPRLLGDTLKIEKIDTAFRVVYVDSIKPDTIKPVHKHNLEPVFFMNGKFVNKELFNILNPQKIENIEILRSDTLIDNIKYHGKIYIITKNDYTPKSISLSGIKNKYTNLKGKPVLFFVDGNMINADYDNYLIDENNLLTMYIGKFENAKEHINLSIITVLTRSDENIKNRKKVIIRGTELTMNK